MKKNFIYALMGAIALIGATGFTSCSEEDLAEVNPTYNPETGELNVDFVFSVSTSNTPTTRMSAANTQANPSNAFRGLTNATLWTFKHGTTDGSGSFTPVDGTKIDYDYGTANADITGSTYTGEAVNKTYYLGTVLAGNAISQADANSDNHTSHRIIELALPSGTNNLMFWGKAIKDGTDAQQGKASWIFGDNLKDITISTDKIITTDNKIEFDEYLALLSECLTNIVRASVTKEITYSTETPKSGTFRWSDYVTFTMNTDDTATEDVDESLTINKIEAKTTNPYTTPSEPISALGEILAGAYTTLNTVYANELRSGSAPAIKYMMQDLYSVIYPVSKADPLSLEEAIAKEVAEAILTEIEKTFDVAESASDTYTFGNYYSPKTIISKYSLSTANYPTIGNESSNETLRDFPRSFDLPYGATILTFNKENKTDENSFQWVYMSQVPTYAMGTVGGSFDPNNYMYPPELCYFANSTIRTSDKAHVAADYPDGPAKWEKSASWTSNDGWVSGTDDKGSHVISTTRSVAMKDNIQYGSALLKSTVQLGTTELQDNNEAIQRDRFHVTESNHIITPTSADGFLWTGVLVGGQTQSVGWNYLAKIGSGFNYMVYDCALPSEGGVAVPEDGNPTTPNYTLVWDNWDNSCKNAKQRDVYIALEFVNNVQDFWGQNNLIRKGGTFYLIGKLDPNKLSSSQDLSPTDLSKGITWPTNYAIPPYDTDGSTLEQRRVFIQDYMTSANFVIGATSLQHALVAVPDLRSSQISLGLSVDLKWQTGLTYENVILGE